MNDMKFLKSIGADRMGYDWRLDLSYGLGLVLQCGLWIGLVLIWTYFMRGTI